MTEKREIKKVKLQDIKLDGINVRTDLDTPNSQENLNELAESIRINGLLQPIVLKGIEGNPPYDVIVGQRRYLAHKKLRKTSIDAIFSGELDDTKVLLLSLSENICRQELNFSDISNAVTKLYLHFNKNEKKVKKHLGISLRTIRSYIKIEEQASTEIKQMLRKGEIKIVDAKRAIDASNGDKSKATELAKEIKKLTFYEKKRVVEIGSKNKKLNVKEIVKKAKKPRIEETLLLNLPLKVSRALSKAAKDLSLSGDELALTALKDWLQTNDYLLND